nr:uncharacterized protein LOC111512541 [Leptinotarsa decemlineata]
MAASIYLKVVFLLAAWTYTVICENIDEFREHTKRISPNKFPCSEPQPRVLYLKDLVEENVYQEKYRNIIQHIYPINTILHRCENTGCCGKFNERCKAMNDDDVDLTFMSVRSSSVEFYHISATNHTLCGCQKISENDIK